MQITLVKLLYQTNLSGYVCILWAPLLVQVLCMYKRYLTYSKFLLLIHKLIKNNKIKLVLFIYLFSPKKKEYYSSNNRIINSQLVLKYKSQYDFFFFFKWPSYFLPNLAICRPHKKIMGEFGSAF